MKNSISFSDHILNKISCQHLQLILEMSGNLEEGQPGHAFNHWPGRWRGGGGGGGGGGGTKGFY